MLGICREAGESGNLKPFQSAEECSANCKESEE